jgi:hypothetical protein
MFFSIGEHIAGYLIHLNKTKSKWKSKTTQNWSKLNGISTIYVLQFVKSFTIYYTKCVCPRILVSKVYVQELKWESTKKVSTKKLNNKKFFSCPNWEKKYVLGHKY